MENWKEIVREDTFEGAADSHSLPPPGSRVDYGLTRTAEGQCTPSDKRHGAPTHNHSHDPWKGVKVGEAKTPAPSPLFTPAAINPGKARILDFGQTDQGNGKRADKEALRVVTANGTCWTSLKEYIKQCEAHVLCLEEHKLTRDQIAEAV